VIDFRMPSLGADMEAGTLVEWLVKPGDRVKRGDVVAVVETQKGAIEIEIFETGEVAQILVDVGGKVPVGTPLAKVQTEGVAKAGAMDRAPAVGAPSVAPVVLATPTPQAPAPGAMAPSPAQLPPSMAAARTPAGVRASPAARRLAQAHDLDLATVTGSGPASAIVLADVEQRLAAVAPATEKPAVAPAAERPAERKSAVGLDFDAMRAAIAAAMARSKREIPHYYLSHQCLMTAAEEWLARINADRPPEKRLLMNALTVKAVARAVRRFAAFNGFHREGRFVPSDGVHVGVAIALRGGGLIAPAIHDTAELPLDELMSRMRDLVQRARAGRIRSSEMADPTITVSSLGERGVEALYGIIYPPQVAIVGFGKVVVRPWVVDGAIGPRSVVTLTLAADHRVSDGHAGALFLAEIGKLLQEPEKL
jgi:pyruvate dehydrogenase E2 component (dihydrolipoamide acetyltransferase)